MALSDYALCEIADVKSDMNLGEDETEKDPIIEALINAYSPVIENYLNKYVINRDLIEEYDGNGTDTLLLNYCPVVPPITSLKIDDVTISVDDYYLYKDNGKIVLDNNTFDKGNQNVEVQYKTGYGDTLEDIPFPIRQACASLVQFYLKRHNIDFSETFSEGFVIKYPISRLPDFIKEFLDPYRKILI